MKSLIFDYAKAKQNSSDDEISFLNILGRYRKVHLSWPYANLTLINESLDCEDPKAYQQLSAFSLLKLFEIEVEPLSCADLPQAASFVSPEKLFIVYVLMTNKISVRVSDMTLESKFVKESMEGISKICDK